MLRLTPFVLLATLTVGCDGGNSANGAGTPGPDASAPAAGAIEGNVLAQVGSVSVTQDEFEQAAARKSPAEGEALSTEEKREVLDRLVSEKVLYLKALDKGLDRDPKVQKVMINTLLRDEVYGTVRNSDFGEEELQAYFEAHKSEFVVPEKVQVKRILIRVKDDRSDEDAKAEAERLHKDLSANPSQFKDLAAKHSEDPYKRRGGDLGFISKEGKPGLDSALVDRAFELEVNQLSEVFRTDEGYNILLVANKREAVERTFQQMKGSVLRKVKNERLKTLYDEYVAKLAAGIEVTVDAEALDAIEVKAVRRPSLGVPLDAGLRAPPSAGIDLPGGK
jgi:peptidyl-prolyl cis-trans isomerase C